MAILFAFHLNYIPVHLATETHVSEFFASIAHLVFHEHHHAAKERQENHHLPHPASDHALDLAVRNQSLSLTPDIFLLPANTTTLSGYSPVPPLPILERIKPPGESPPDPLQPRAPPVA